MVGDETRTQERKGGRTNYGGSRTGFPVVNDIALANSYLIFKVNEVNGSKLPMIELLTCIYCSCNNYAASDTKSIILDRELHVWQQPDPFMQKRTLATL